MSALRQVARGASSVLAAAVLWLILLLTTIAVSVGLGVPLSIPFVVTTELLEAPALSDSTVELPGLLIGIPVLSVALYLGSRRARARRREDPPELPGDAVPAAG